MAYAVGVVLALTLCARVSEGHFSSGITFVLVLLGKCTPARGLRQVLFPIYVHLIPIELTTKPLG